MKSIKSKIIILVLSCVIISSLAIGITSFYNAQRVVVKDSTQIMNLLCENRAENFNKIFERIEQTVETLSVYAKQNITKLDTSQIVRSDSEMLANELIPIIMDATKYNEGIITAYLRFEPSLSNSKAGFFFGIDSDKKTYYRIDTTDLSLYDEDDRSHVGWFYEPKKAEKPTWLDPYYNKNIEKEIISYVIPIYLEDTFIGVVGMDIDFQALKTIVAETKVYDSGYAFLTDDTAHIVYHKELETGTNLVHYNNREFKEMAQYLFEDKMSSDTLINYDYQGIEKEATFRKLENGMRFVLSAPKSEIDEEVNNLLYQMVIGVLAVILIASVLTFIFAKKLVKPLIELTNAAKRVENGDLDVAVTHTSKDEVGKLSESFRHTVVHLKGYFTYINELAYKDSLTGVKNNAAYIEAVKVLDEKIMNKTARFSMIIFDINDLKVVNDTLGHDSGDLFIIGASRIICKIFNEYPIYRIGGDEFVAILEDDNLIEHQRLIDSFLCEFTKQDFKAQFNIRLFIACGMSTFNPQEDKAFKDVFKKADIAMYECKRRSKDE